MAGYFITGTDTGVGKTCVSIALMRAFKAQGQSVAGMKPVSAGCTQTGCGVRNEDAELLLTESSIDLPYCDVNPYAYEPPVAPHIAAHMAGENIDINTIQVCFNKITEKAGQVIVEGAGGWLVPINDAQTMADVAIQLQLPVILVVGLRLGCLNHALLSVASIKSKGLKLAGWVANHISQHMKESQANISSLQQRISAPLIGIIPYSPDDPPHHAMLNINIEQLKR